MLSFTFIVIGLHNEFIWFKNLERESNIASLEIFLGTGLVISKIRLASFSPYELIKKTSERQFCRYSQAWNITHELTEKQVKAGIWSFLALHLFEDDFRATGISKIFFINIQKIAIEKSNYRKNHLGGTSQTTWILY